MRPLTRLVVVRAVPVVEDRYFYIRNEYIEIAINAELGASIVAMFYIAGTAPIALMPDTRHDRNETALDSSSFIMAPYSNRVRGGRFSYDGKEYQLKRRAEHAIHGDVRRRPFNLLSITQDRISLRYDSESFDDVDWPWPFLLDVVYAIDSNTMATELALTNLGQSEMPAGFGIHPFFSLDPFGTGRNEARIQFDAEGEYPTDNEEIPIGSPVKRRQLELYRTGSPPEPGNHYYSGWTGTGRVSWPASGIALELECEGPFRHLICWSPDAPYFAFEPVTNATDGLNQRSRGLAGHGIVSLLPGDCLDGRVVMKILG